MARESVMVKSALVGVIDGTHFYRLVDPDKHLLASRKAYVLLDEVLDRLVDSGVDTVILQEPNRRLVSSVEDWQALGEEFAGSARSLAVSHMSAQ